MKCVDWFFKQIVTRGVIRSLYRFSETEGISYSSARRCVAKLEDRGQIVVKRQPGRPLIITKTDGDR